MTFERQESAGYMTNWTARLFFRSIDRRLKTAGLSPAHMPVFFALGAAGELTQSELAERAAIEQPTMAATLTRMERDGLIERHADPADKRRSLVRLTQKAQDLTVHVLEAVDEVNGLAFAGIPEADHAHYLTTLERVVENLQADLGGVPKDKA